MDTENYSLLETQLSIGGSQLKTNSNAVSSIHFAGKVCVEQTSTSENESFSEMVPLEMYDYQEASMLSQSEGTYSVGQKIDDLLDMAIKCRTADGSVDPPGMSLLLDKLEEIDNTDDALIKFTKAVLGGVQVKLQKNSGGGAKGRSGAAIYFVYDGSAMVAVCKKFPTSEELVRELSSLSRLREPEFTCFKIPAPLAAAKIKDSDYAGVLVSKVAQGESIADLIDSITKATTISARKNILNQLQKAVVDIARALAQLHTEPIGSGNLALNSYLTKSINRVRHLVSVVAKEHAKLQDIFVFKIDEVRQQLDHLIEECCCEQSKAAIVHGDAHPGNLFWDSSVGVTFIDTPSLHYSMDSMGKPIGTPERDIASFEGRLVELCRKAGISENESKSFRDTFLNNYDAEKGGSLSEKKLKFFQLRFVLGELVQACNNERSKDIQGSKDIQEAIVSLKQILGWKN
ncbi:unnamed protein product [Adineta steineri]|uniref:Aminoglycoside phosphotransferase domain-containing protein n=1 Tax=Adineta steineri TaxID=433720 RepID=A0A814G1M1_9BILA|nr:unnamed protein product [Adineta steineri]CAF0988766.1 unnamed protein product [Adineta steineri]